MSQSSPVVGRGDPPGRPAAADEPAARPYLGRRAFFRAVLLAGTGGLAWVLLRRSCAGKGACGSCASFAGCGLPWKEARR